MPQAQPAGDDICLNGKTLPLRSGHTVATLLKELGLGGRIAVELNRQIVPRSRFGSCTLQPGDRIEIVRAIGGG